MVSAVARCMRLWLPAGASASLRPFTDCCTARTLTQLTPVLAIPQCRFRLPVPSLQPRQWQLLALVMLRALADRHLPTLLPAFLDADSPLTPAAGPQGGAGGDVRAGAGSFSSAVKAGGGGDAGQGAARWLGVLAAADVDLEAFGALVACLRQPATGTASS